MSPLPVGVLLAALCLSGCVSETREAWRPAKGPNTEEWRAPFEPTVPSVAPSRKGSGAAPVRTEAPPACAHVWVQADWHTYQVISDGAPLQAICVVARCARCGAVRHDCTRSADDTRRRTPRTR
jgi:hypothetical protein